MPTAVVDTQTNEFEAAGHVADGRYVVVNVPRSPDPRTEKWDGSAIVPKSSAEIAAAVAATLSAQSLATSRQKDVLTTLAVIVRAKNTPAWNAMTTVQKVNATLAEADVWKGIREFLADKV